MDWAKKIKALGFIRHPRPEKRDRVVLALRWLSSRPRVTGRVIERVIGHCIHMMMLRREFLSVFRSVYDFKTARYHEPQRLWRPMSADGRRVF